jgi:hypothetical protein
LCLEAAAGSFKVDALAAPDAAVLIDAAAPVIDHYLTTALAPEPAGDQRSASNSM